MDIATGIATTKTCQVTVPMTSTVVTTSMPPVTTKAME